MLVLSYSGRSKPSALKIAEEGEVELRRSSRIEVDVNWGRAIANSQLNSDISNATNKRRMRELFREHGVPMPKLYTTEEALQASLQGPTDFVGRPERHTKGRGFWRCQGYTQIHHALRGTRRKKAATHFMEYIESAREYRVHVFLGKSIRISEKAFEPDGKYTTKKPGNISLKKVRNAAKAAVEAVGLDFGAVDILARGDNNAEVFVLEVNAAPGLGGSMPRLWYETFKKWKEGNWE